MAKVNYTKISDIIIKVFPIIISFTALIISWLSFNVSKESSNYEHSPMLSLTYDIKRMLCSSVEQNITGDSIYDLTCRGEVQVYNNGGVEARINSLEAIIETEDEIIAHCYYFSEVDQGCITELKDISVLIDADFSKNTVIEPQDLLEIVIYLHFQNHRNGIIFGVEGNDFKQAHPDSQILNSEIWLNFLNHDALILTKSTLGYIVIP
jgi:hypothetical protein